MTSPEIIEDAAKAAFTKAQSVYRKDHDHFPLRNTWETATESVRDGWRSIAYAAVEAAETPQLGTMPEPRPTRTLRFTADAAPVAEPGEPAAWLHEIYEPGKKDPLRMLSFSSDNPWSYWMAEYFARCRYQCTPLAAPPARQDGALREALVQIANAPMGGIRASAIARATLAQSAAPVQPSPAMRETMWGEVVDDDYEGIAFRLTEEGNRDGHHFLKEIALAAETFPLGTKITVAEPVQQSAPSGEEG